MRLQLQTLYGVKFVEGTVTSLAEAKETLGCRMLVNATGLGAGVLANDPAVIGVRGQTIHIKYPADGTTSGPMSRQIMIRRGTEYTYMIPRAFSGGVVLGGFEDPGNTDTDIDPVVQKDILRRANIMAKGQFDYVDLEKDTIRHIVGFRPGRTGGYRVEREGDIVHAYGFGGSGYRYSFGAAQRVLYLVEELLGPW